MDAETAEVMRDASTVAHIIGNGLSSPDLEAPQLQELIDGLQHLTRLLKRSQCLFPTE